MRGLITGVLAAALAVAGCAAEPAVSPLPTDAGAAPPGPAASGPASGGPAGSGPASSAPPSAAPTSRRPGRPAATPRATPTSNRPTTAPASSCRGAIVYTIDTTTDELALVPSLCVGVGAVLRIENIGPGEVTTDSPTLVDPNYEAGVVEIRFLRAGTVVVTIPHEGSSYDVTVVVR
jgi:hypothetical protein